MQGWHGLAMAKTYLEAHEGLGEKVLILDEAKSIGGTWAEERLYTGLNTNNIVGSYEFSDFPMTLERYNMKPGQHIPGKVVHQYLNDFAAHFDLTRRIQLQTEVKTIHLQDDETWLIDASLHTGAGYSSLTQFVARRLVIATGVTSQPRIPSYPGNETFMGHLCHAKDLHSAALDLASSHIVLVVGGNKSAWDVCYSAARAGAKVHMVVRTSGGGPSWVWKPLRWGLSGFTLTMLSSTRFFTWFDPNPFGTAYRTPRRFLHETALGRCITALFWALLGFCVESAMGYRDPKLEVLRPWTSIFWMGNSLNIHNYDTEWLDLVRNGMITIHHAEITSLDDTLVHLSDGKSVEADAVVSCTGWICAPKINFQPDSLVREMGIPLVDLPGKRGTSTEDVTDDLYAAEQSALVVDAHHRIMQKCSALMHTPTQHIRGSSVARKRKEERLPVKASMSSSRGRDPYRLYRFLVPPGGHFLKMRNLAFIGAHRSFHAVIVAQCQALWITAFFQDNLLHLDRANVLSDTIFHTEYERLRRPREAGGSGNRYPDLVFDSIPYVDLLLEDIGLRSLRKDTTWGNIFKSLTLQDYQGLTQEYCARWSAKTSAR